MNKDSLNYPINKVEQLEMLMAVKTSASLAFEKICYSQDEQGRKAVLEWHELKNHQNTLEKEWLYLEGLKDGLRLTISIGLLPEFSDMISEAT